MTTDIWDATLDGQSDADSSSEANERIVVASVMSRPELIDELAAEFDPADLFHDRLRWVWHAVDEIRQSLTNGEIRWQAVDRQLQSWKASGYMPVPPPTMPQLAQLYEEAQPSYQAAAYYAQQVTEEAIRRRYLALQADMGIRGRSPAFDPDTDIGVVQDALDSLVRGDAANATKLVGDIIGGALERAITPPTNENRIPTGFIDLDSLFTGGLAAGQMVVVGARPAMGKTTLGLGLARAAAIHNGIPTLFESLEMSEDELGSNILSAEARIPLHHIKQGIVTDADLSRAARFVPRITEAPLHISDSAHLTLPALRGKIRHLVRTAGLRLVVIDYLQLMQAPKAENRQAEVAKLSRGLKLLAKEFGITVVVLAQLNRGPEQRTEKKPLVSDLRESGAIEQDADIVILLHREDAYEKESPRAGEADFIVGKHRGGPTATITTAFQGHYAQFIDMAQS